MTHDMMTQCRLVRRDGAQDVRWIESGFAVQGKPLRIKTDGKWEDNWSVLEAWTGTELPAHVIHERSRDHKNHRKATDV